MNVGLALTSALYGATVINHMEVKDLIKDPVTGKITGVKVKDLLHERRSGRLGFGEGVGQDEFLVEAKVRRSDLPRCQGLVPGWARSINDMRI